ncbi:MAG: hypothetical protein KIPDCIKN_04345 [Haliscomenobacter sp.]|nr:hypothetical protein [Haliscomenobacter sp.]
MKPTDTDIRDFLTFLRGVYGSGRAPLVNVIRTSPAYVAWLAVHEYCGSCKAWVPFVRAKSDRLVCLIEHRNAVDTLCLGSGRECRKSGSDRKRQIESVLEFTRRVAEVVVSDAAVSAPKEGRQP